MIIRNLEETIRNHVLQGKAIIVQGSRQTGKTTLLKTLVKNKENATWPGAEEQDTIALYENSGSTRFNGHFMEKLCFE